MGFRIDADKVSYDQIREWLHRCNCQHSSSCRSDISSLPFHLMAIDCLTRDIVYIDPDDDYIAFSYVWGSTAANTTDQETPFGKLPSMGVAAVIEDALVVVCLLGKRYLWVDKYCIDQKDHNSMNVQIRHMYSIYEGAYATIIAAAGSNSEFGLPGVTRAKRRPQTFANVGNMRLLSSLTTLTCALANFTWMTRGWTYQEAVLSRRCLFFTEKQVYFVSTAMTACEAVVTGPNSEVGNLKSGDTGLNPYIFQKPDFLDIEPELRLLVRHIQYYFSRQLSHESDALNALRGLLRREKFHTYFGIPIAPTDQP